jgi:hypothetical protein
MKELKLFDLELALAGDPVVTRSGYPVRIICSDRKNDNYPIIALVYTHEQEYFQDYTVSGKYDIRDNFTSGYDLFMAPTKKPYYVNIYKAINTTLFAGAIVDSMEKAKTIDANADAELLLTLVFEADDCYAKEKKF